MDASEFHPCDVPDKPGVYVFRDRFGKVIYVGKAIKLRRRLSSYFHPSKRINGDPKLRSLIHSISDWSFETVKNEDEALILESNLIKTYAPYYNILMRDDKRYPLLQLDKSEKFPTLKLARIKKTGDIEYFGPFPQGSAMMATMEYLLRRFGLRGCNVSEPDENTRKHCLKRQMHDCSAPCICNISQQEYQKKVSQCLNVLKGDIGDLRHELQESIKKAAVSQKFEKAAKLRDVLTNLETVFGHKSRSFDCPELPGCQLGLSAVNDLKIRLGLATAPREIIGFDISNLFGTQAVSGMVCFIDGVPCRSRYRRFRIKTITQSNDFAMIGEAVERHFTRLQAENGKLPDLMLIDGGIGQLNSALKVLMDLKIPPFPVLGLAEKNEEIYLPGESTPLVLDRHTPALRLLQSVRDETHRFSVTYHRLLRHNRIEHSRLDDVRGVGPVRKKTLLKVLGSIRKIKQHSADELAELVPGLGKNIAGKVLDAIRDEIPNKK